MGAPPPSARIEERSHSASLWVQGFGSVTFEGIAHVAAKRQVPKVVTPAFRARNYVVNGEYLADDALLRSAILTAAASSATDAVDDPGRDKTQRRADSAVARLTINCSWRLQRRRSSFC